MHCRIDIFLNYKQIARIVLFSQNRWR